MVKPFGEIDEIEEENDEEEEEEEMKSEIHSLNEFDSSREEVQVEDEKGDAPPKRSSTTSVHTDSSGEDIGKLATSSQNDSKKPP